MYWWNASKLAEDLREGRIERKECWKYLLADLVLWCLIVRLITYSGGPFLPELPEPPEAILVWVIVAFAAIYGIVIVCLVPNEKGDNADFTPRMICLALPAGVCTAAVFATVYLSLGVIESLPAAALGLESFVTRIPGSTWKIWAEASDGIVGVILGAYFMTIYNHIAFAAREKDAEVSPHLEQTKSTCDGLITGLGLLSGLGILVMMAYTGVWVPGSDGRVPKWQLMGAVLLWAWLFSFVFSRLRQALRKPA